MYDLVRFFVGLIADLLRGRSALVAYPLHEPAFSTAAAG
jgi:hypothetical protein